MRLLNDNDQPKFDTAHEGFEEFFDNMFEGQDPTEQQKSVARTVWMAAVLWSIAFKHEIPDEEKRTFTERRRMIDIAEQNRRKALTVECAEFIARILPTLQ